MHGDVGVRQALELLRVVVALVARDDQRAAAAQRGEAAEGPERADGEEEGGADGAVVEAVAVPREEALEVQLVAVLRPAPAVV